MYGDWVTNPTWRYPIKILHQGRWGTVGERDFPKVKYPRSLLCFVDLPVSELYGVPNRRRPSVRHPKWLCLANNTTQCPLLLYPPLYASWLRVMLEILSSMDSNFFPTGRQSTIPHHKPIMLRGWCPPALSWFDTICFHSSLILRIWSGAEVFPFKPLRYRRRHRAD